MTRLLSVHFGGVMAVLLGLVFCVAVLAQTAPSSWVKVLPAQGYSPVSVVIVKEAPPSMLVCAEPEWGGTFSCLTVGEFRMLVSKRKAK